MDLFEQERKKYRRQKKEEICLSLPVSQIKVLEKMEKVYGVSPSFYVARILDFMLIKDDKYY